MSVRYSHTLKKPCSASIPTLRGIANVKWPPVRPTNNAYDMYGYTSSSRIRNTSDVPATGSNAH